MPDTPLFSIITACYNSAGHIGNCLDSIAAQTSKRYEHIIVDGGSTDGTLDYLQQADSPHIRWISEPDLGIADAMNKGIKLARGEWLLFIQSDDWLLDANSLAQLKRHLPTEPCILGLPVWLVGANKRSKVKSREWSLRTRFKIPLCHQGAVIHRSLFDQLSVYDTSFSITMDYDWFLRAYRNGVELQKSDLIISCMGAEGLSSREDWQSLITRFQEERRAHFKNSSQTWRIIYRLYWLFYPHYRRLRYLLTTPSN